LLARVAAAAAGAGQWPVARRAYDTLFARFPSAVTPESRLRYAETLLRTGATADARTRLEQIAAAGGREAPGAARLLVEIHDGRGDRRAAVAAMRRLVEVSQGDAAAEAAYRLGERLRADGQHAAAAEWYFTAVYLGERSRWARLSLLGAGRSLTALRETREALAAYWKLVARRPDYDPAEDRETSGEAAYLAAEILRDVGLHEEAVEMFAMSAHLTTGSPAEPRALLGALKCFVALGDPASADRTFQRLSRAAAADPALVAEARKALGPSSGASALPKNIP
jgi:tetratricopeptide (TPR) repeat protein